MGRRFRLGNFELVVVSDGMFKLDAGGIFGITPRIMWEPMVEELDDQHRLPLSLNCLLIRAPGKTVLVETGCGNKGTQISGSAGVETAGTLLGELAEEGVDRKDIDVVVNSHLHFDHAGGNTILDEGKIIPTFPNARYIVQSKEWEAAQHPNERTRAIYLEENLAPPADAGLVDVEDGEVEIAQGVRMVPAPGHSAGHAAIEVESAGELLIYLGDVAVHPISLERLAWIGAFDAMPMLSLETKRRLLNRAIEEQALLATVHAPYPGLGRLRQQDRKRRWEPE